jgi:hypothetical protein
MRTYKLIWSNGQKEIIELMPIEIAKYMKMLIKNIPNDKGIILNDIKIVQL